MFAAVVYGVLYIYQLFTNIEVYSCNVLYHKDTKISVYFFPLQKNGQKFYSLCPILSHLQLGGEKCLLFTSKLANQGVRKRYLLVWYLLILMTLHMPMFVEPCYLLCYISIHPLVVQSGLVWSGQASVVQPSSPFLPNAFGT